MKIWGVSKRPNESIETTDEILAIKTDDETVGECKGTDVKKPSTPREIRGRDDIPIDDGISKGRAREL